MYRYLCGKVTARINKRASGSQATCAPHWPGYFVRCMHRCPHDTKHRDTHTQETVSTTRTWNTNGTPYHQHLFFRQGKSTKQIHFFWGLPLWPSPTRSCRSSTTCWTQSFTSQESVFSTNSGASGFSYSESIPVKPTEGPDERSRWKLK